jgi:hypothetical protein
VQFIFVHACSSIRYAGTTTRRDARRLEALHGKRAGAEAYVTKISVSAAQRSRFGRFNLYYKRWFLVI